MAWKPIYASAVVVLGIAIVIGAALLLKRRAENLEAQQTPTPQVSPSSTPGDLAANVQSAAATSNQSPPEKPNSAETLVVLNDGGGTITLDKSGNVTGLDDLPANLSQTVTEEV